MRKAGLWGAVAAAVAIVALAVTAFVGGQADRPTMTTIQAQNGPCITEC